MGKSEKTRQYIIEKTAPVFNIHGFEGTTLSLLQESTGLTKGSLYGNFSDKEEIAQEAFRYSMQTTREFVSRKLEKESTAKGKLFALLNFYADYVFNPPIAGGCPLLNNAVEADDSHKKMKKVVAQEIDRTVTFIAGLLDEGKKKGEFESSMKSNELAMLFFTAIEGAVMVSRVSASDKPMRTVVQYCKRVLNSISIK